MNLERIGVHRSVGAVFPPEKLVESLADLDIDLAVVGDNPDDLRACDAVVTFEHREAFLEAVGWVHSIHGETHGGCTYSYSKRPAGTNVSGESRARSRANL